METDNLAEAAPGWLRHLPLRPLLLVASALALIALALFLAPAERGAGTLSSPVMLVLLPVAFLGGVLSFLSPCTLPILPAYFAISVRARSQNVVLVTVAFFFGLATTLSVLGASATAVGALAVSYLAQLTTIGGAIIVLFGVMSLIGKGFSGFQGQEPPETTVAGSYMYGATFALGWTTCIGPILGAVLTLLVSQGVAVLQGALLAFVFALGLGLPLILVSALFGRLDTRGRFWRLLRGRGFVLTVGPITLYLHTTSALSGLLLVLSGSLLLSGRLTEWTQLAAGGDFALQLLELEERLWALFKLR